MLDYRERRPKRRKFWFRKKSSQSAPKTFSPPASAAAPKLSPLPRRPKREPGWQRGSKVIFAALSRPRLPGASAFFVLGVIWLAAGLGWTVWKAWDAPLTSLNITGIESLTPVRVAAAAGLYPGIAVGGLDPLALAERLLREPRIARADVRRTFPGGLDVRVTERRPAAWVDSDDGLAALVDREGYVLERGSPSGGQNDPELPRLFGTPRGAFTGAKPGERITDARFRRAMDLAESAMALDALTDERISVDARDLFSIRMGLERRGRTLILPASHAEPALRAYLETEASLGEIPDDYRTIDLRAAAREGASWIAYSR